MGKYNSQDFINQNYYSTFIQHHFLRINTLSDLIMDNFQCAFDPGCEVLDKNNPFQNIFSTNKKGIGKQNPQDIIQNHYYSTFKEKKLLVISSLGHLIILTWQCAFDPGCEVLEKNNPFQICFFVITASKVNIIHSNLLMTILIQLSNIIILWV